MHLFALSFSINIDSALNFSEKPPKDQKQKMWPLILRTPWAMKTDFEMVHSVPKLGSS